MSSSLDFTLLPLVRHSGKDHIKMPGLYAAEPPRSAARGRSSDYLIIHLALDGNAPLSTRGMNKLLESLATAYYKTVGSSTAAMRAVAEGLNEYLLKRNLNAVSRGLQAIGMLTLGVMRHNRIYLLQSGPGQAYLIRADGVQQFYDPDAAGRGLGLSRATSFLYHQSKLSAGDVLLISPEPPLAWNTTTLRTFHGLPLGDLHRRLIRRAGSNLDAAMMLVQDGSGNMRLLRPQSNRGQDQTSRNESQPTRESVSQAGVAADVSGVKTSPPVEASLPAASNPPPVVSPAAKTSSLRKAWSTTIGPGLLALGRAVGKMFRQAAQTLGTLVQRMLPDEELLSLSRSTMAFIAVAVPLIVVTVASIVYFKRGREVIYDKYFSEAQYAMGQAQQYELAGQQRIAWGATLEYIDLAEEYRVTKESQGMRNQARMALDALNFIKRVDYQAADIDGLPRSVNITRIVPVQNTDLYLLDEVEGKVYRAVFTGDGLELDKAFQCEPMPGPLIVGKLVDIVPLPQGSSDGATIMGMDENGNLLRCIPGSDAPLGFSMGPPDSNWGVPQAAVMDRRVLYVMDAMTSSVWVYDGSDEYRELPDFFFGADVPSMQDVVDLTVGNGKLYLLYSDGRLTTSFTGGDAYKNPAIYHDSREGMEDGEKVEGATFSEILFTHSPVSSVYLLDPVEQAIYQFTPKLVYQQQYRSRVDLPKGQATAFAITPNERVFLAIGDSVYYASFP
ncbi:MAG: hypothetical protein U9Q82_14865 [Chloroflexota bacterium]|nr:hypothetical protein [Chloroflexota bacterium]